MSEEEYEEEVEEEEEYYAPEEEEVEEEEEEPEDIDEHGIEIVQQELTPDRIRLIPPEQSTTPIYLSRYEKTRVITKRAREIQGGSRPKVSLEVIEKQEIIDPVIIALMEYNAELLNYKIRRHFPNGSYEEYELHELIDYDIIRS